MYLGTVVLQMTEERFWRTTPRTLTALAMVHSEHHAGKKKSGVPKKPTAFIDQILPF